jgi:hypothetical protein
VRLALARTPRSARGRSGDWVTTQLDGHFSGCQRTARTIAFQGLGEPDATSLLPGETDVSTFALGGHLAAGQIARLEFGSRNHTIKRPEV